MVRSLAALALLLAPATLAQDADLTSGTGGTESATPVQIWGTHGVEVTVLDTFELASMTLRRVHVSFGPVTVSARVYLSSSQQLLAASGAATVWPGSDQTVTVPIACTLAGGATYRVVCYQLEGPGNQIRATVFDPNPVGSGGFPYVESNGRLQIESAWRSNGDQFPTDPQGSVLSLTLGSATAPFCFGDDSGTDCPCSTALGGSVPPGSPGRGCPSSTSAAGALLSSVGSPRLSADGLVLHGASMPNGSALYFQGQLAVGSGSTWGTEFGDGLRCVQNGIVRLKPVTNVSGASSYPQPGDPSVSVRGGVLAPGTRHYQVWYRNAAAFCTPSTFNLTNGLRVVWSS